MVVHFPTSAWVLVLGFGGVGGLPAAGSGSSRPLAGSAIDHGGSTPASFPPASSGGEWQGKKEDSVSFEVQGEGWMTGWRLGKCGGNGVHPGMEGALFAAQAWCSGHSQLQPLHRCLAEQSPGLPQP